MHNIQYNLILGQVIEYDYSVFTSIVCVFTSMERMRVTLWYVRNKGEGYCVCARRVWWNVICAKWRSVILCYVRDGCMRNERVLNWVYINSACLTEVCNIEEWGIEFIFQSHTFHHRMAHPDYAVIPSYSHISDPWTYLYANTHTHTHTYTHIYIRIYTHTPPHTYTPTHTHTHKILLVGQM